MTDEPIYQLSNIVKRYGERTVLRIGALEIRRGEILALVGPSGAGKSTLLRLLNFLETPDEGRLHFLGKAYEHGQIPPLEQRRQVTTVFQRPVLLNRTVEGNVAYGLWLRGQNTHNGLMHDALQSVGLETLARQPARTLSGGEAQRVALARAMVIHPTALLLDEPTANLDPYNVGLLEGIIRQVNQQQHTTLVVVTHNVFQAKRLAHRVALILNGEIVEVNEADHFFEAPTDARTKAFLNGELVY